MGDLVRMLPLLASCAIHFVLVAAALGVDIRVTPRMPPTIDAVLVITEPPPKALEAPKREIVEPPRPQQPPSAIVPPPLETPTALPEPKPDARAPEAVTSSLHPPADEQPPIITRLEPSRPATSGGSTLQSGVTAISRDDGGEATVPRSAVPGPPAAAPPASAATSTGPGPLARTLPLDGVTQTAIPRGGYQVRPTYPSSARRAGIQGTTLLRVYVNHDGRVTEVSVERSAGNADLDQAAADAVRRWHFEPGRRGSEAIGMWVLLPVEFRLQ